MADGVPPKLETYEVTLRVECQGRSESTKVILQPQRLEAGFVLGHAFMVFMGMIVDVHHQE